MISEQQASTIFNTINDWSVTNEIQTLYCDTTASNTGQLNRACILLEQLLMNLSVDKSKSFTFTLYAKYFRISFKKWWVWNKTKTTYNWFE